MNSPLKILVSDRSSGKPFTFHQLFSVFLLVLSAFLTACGGGSSGGGGGPVSGSGIVLTGTLDSQSIQVARIQGSFERLYAMIFPRAANASVQTVTSIIARSTDGSTTETASISNSSFSISLPSGKTYLILLLDGTTTVGTLTVDPTSGMAIIPVSTSSQSFSLGTVSLSGSTASPTISESQLLTSLGIDTTEAATLSTYTQTVTWIDNADVDGDGILDYKENRLYKFYIDYWLGQGYSGSGMGTTFMSAQSNYVTPPTVTSSTPNGYTFGILESGTSLSTMPTFNTSNLPSTNCILSSNIDLDAPGNVTAYGSNTNTIRICEFRNLSSSSSISLNGQTLTTIENYEFGTAGGPGSPFLNPVTPPTGTYRMTGSGTSNCGTNGCTLTFNNVSSISMSQIKNIFYPSIKLTMSGSTVTGFSWQWYEYNASTNSWIQPSISTLQSVLTEATAEFGNIGETSSVDVSIGITPSGTATVPNTGCNTNTNCMRLSLEYGDIGGYIYSWGDY